MSGFKKFPNENPIEIMEYIIQKTPDLKIIKQHYSEQWSIKKFLKC